MAAMPEAADGKGGGVPDMRPRRYPLVETRAIPYVLPAF